MTQIVAVRGVLPQHRYAQADVTAGFADLILAAGAGRQVLQRIHGNAGVSYRHLALPLENYPALDNFGAANDAFIACAGKLGAQAVTAALDAACLQPSDVDLVVSTTITGLAVPSIDARLMQPMGFRTDVKRIPIVGLGCVAGAAGIARLHDYLLGHPDDVALLLSVELCSLTVQRSDASMANLVASGLFGDGAAAVVATGDNVRLTRQPNEAGCGHPSVISTRSRMYPDSERAMGWDVGSTGLRIVLGVEVPDLVRAHIGADVDDFLESNGLSRSDIDWWVCHPGGPKILEAIQAGLGLPPEALAVTWASLDQIGNLSSASVLHVLADTLAHRPPVPGTYGLTMAMGPGFCLELVLMRA
jgi:alkylresorcinol/alkylpyrone synthase